MLGQSDLDELLAQRDKINQRLQHIIDEHTEPWGVKVSVVEVKDVLLPEAMQRSMAAQAEAEREKRAKVIRADADSRFCDRPCALSSARKCSASNSTSSPRFRSGGRSTSRSWSSAASAS